MNDTYSIENYQVNYIKDCDNIPNNVIINVTYSIKGSYSTLDIILPLGGDLYLREYLNKLYEEGFL